MSNEDLIDNENYNTADHPDYAYNELAREVANCKKCDLGCVDLLEGYDPHVMGNGGSDSGLMFIAEAPGLQETKHKCPLTPPGTSGKLYEKVLESLGVSRDEVYTTNTVLCRPPKNRDPEPWEVNKCKPYLIAQLNLVQPKLVVTFGRFAAQVMLGDFKITKEHGKIRRSELFNVDVFPLYHPAYVKVYAPEKVRKEFSNDIKKLKQIVSNM